MSAVSQPVPQTRPLLVATQCALRASADESPGLAAMWDAALERLGGPATPRETAEARAAGLTNHPVCELVEATHERALAEYHAAQDEPACDRNELARLEAVKMLTTCARMHVRHAA